jgi:hypothetical protein
MQTLLLFLTAIQLAPSPTPVSPSVRGDRFQIIVPQGWKTLNDGGFVLLEHSSGASLLIQRIDRQNNLPEYAQRQAERVMLPLGFATLGEPRAFKEGKDEWVQYEIRGNRLTAHRRILYRLLRRDTSFYEVIYEAGEDRFDALLTEAQEIASSVQSIIESPPPRRRR